MKASAPFGLSTLGSANDQGLGKKRSRDAYYRLRLSPKRTANRLGRHGNWGMWREAVDAQRWRSRKVLPGAEAEKSPGASGDRSDGTLPLVRALTGRAGLRTVGRRRGRDQSRTRPEAEERPFRCQTYSQATDGGSLSQNLDGESGESRRTATAIASSSIRRDADTSDEPATGHCHERRTATEERTV